VGGIGSCKYICGTESVLNNAKLTDCTSLGGKVIIASTLHGVGDLGEHGLHCFQTFLCRHRFILRYQPSQRVYFGVMFFFKHSLSYFVIFIPPIESRHRCEPHVFLCLLNTPYRPAQDTHSKIASQRKSPLLLPTREPVCQRGKYTIIVHI